MNTTCHQFAPDSSGDLIRHFRRDSEDEGKLLGKMSGSSVSRLAAAGTSDIDIFRFEMALILLTGLQTRHTQCRVTQE